jgi:hypothetical protein
MIQAKEDLEMGCDIHCHCEVKIYGVWHHYSVVELQRDYVLFARMANVRNHNNTVPIAEPRGLPEDICLLTQLSSDSWCSNGHSYSWLSIDECQTLVKDEAIKENFSNDIKSLFDYWHSEGSWSNDLEQARLVFWFDN